MVRKTYENEKLVWFSAYESQAVDGWKDSWEKGSNLVLEGWEIWLEEALKVENDDFIVRKKFLALLKELAQAEMEREGRVILIMLEVGRGIVPVEAHLRRLRDLSGWLTQDAASQCEEVHYIWHGIGEQVR
ncbi:bifunctional adenosylcobinamide kinase/adenosylcobinamide-phosphate guanylyltransferase [Sutcliffiella rhizosphaerae]|nr:bifunctional adenosylcobinamide kinase/adenosylcobinamide-phosphate guanylyltransferase [Sutcliffiella rhizosphaerae]